MWMEKPSKGLTIINRYAVPSETGRFVKTTKVLEFLGVTYGFHGIVIDVAQQFEQQKLSKSCVLHAINFGLATARLRCVADFPEALMRDHLGLLSVC